MQWFKYSLFALLIIQASVSIAQKFTSDECLHSEYVTSIKNEGALFGLIKNNLVISKKECEVEIKYQNILETTWKIDICRKPIHIKLSSKGSQSVYKRVGECKQKNDSDYCQYWGELKEVLQDYGLIYAEGEREVIASAHGQTYCSYLLLEEYLGKGTLFSKYEKSKNLFKMKSSDSCELPVKVEGEQQKTHNAVDKPTFEMKVEKEIDASQADQTVGEEITTQEASF